MVRLACIGEDAAAADQYAQPGSRPHPQPARYEGAVVDTGCDAGAHDASGIRCLHSIRGEEICAGADRRRCANQLTEASMKTPSFFAAAALALTCSATVAQEFP